MSTLDILESRISELEKQTFGSEGTAKKETDNSVVENILHANTLISSALSGREKINGLVGRLPELSNYMDPEDDDLPLDAKIQLIHVMEPKIKENLRNLTELQKLSSVFESDRFRDIGEMSQKLEGLSLTYLQANVELENLHENVQDMFFQYNNILSCISNTLQSMDAAVTMAELEALSKRKKK